MKITPIKIIVLIIIVLLVICFFPKGIRNCGGKKLCFGFVKSEIRESVWLDVKNSVLEVHKDEEKSCIGLSMWQYMMFDACPGAWGWFNKRPVDCRSITLSCDYPSELIQGVNCSEWQRACNEIKNKDLAPINIEKINETGVRVGMNS